MPTGKVDRNRLLILNALRRASAPMTSVDLAEVLGKSGHEISSRTVRLYLGELEREGLIERRGRRGRVLTGKGEGELHATQVLERVGYLSARIDQLTYAMDFDLDSRKGKVVVNVAMVPGKVLLGSLEKISRVFERGYAMGNLVGLVGPGGRVGEHVVPTDRVGLCTVCSITLNGVLLKHGVPTVSRFGGLLELQGGRPARFVEMIHYDGTSLDPLEVFIRSGMTDYHGAIRDGNGLIGASYRELPENSRDRVVELAGRLEQVGLGGFLLIGQPGQSVLGVPLSPGRIGAVVIGGLNPIAILEEAGHRVYSRALAGLMDYGELFHYSMLGPMVRAYV